MKGPLLCVVVGIAAAGAFFAGRATGGGDETVSPSAPDVGEAERFERRIDELTKMLAAERGRRAAGETAAGRARAGRADAAEADDAAPESSETTPAGTSAPGGTATAASVAKFSLEGVTSADEGSKRFMAFADAQLARGPEGYDAILDAMGDLWKERKSVEALFGDEATATRHLYPWIRFLVDREKPVVDMSEHVFRRMAEKPESFADLPTDDILEPFAEGVGILLPGIVDEARLAKFRGYAVKFLETPADQQPPALRGIRNDIERLLARFWAAPVTAEEALAKLKAGGVPTRDIARLVRAVPKDALASLDVTALVEPLLKEGDQEAFTVLRAVPADQLDAARCDAALLAGIETGRAQHYFVANWFQRAGRNQWSDVRAFFDRAFTASETARAIAAEALARYLPANLRPEKAYVEDILARGLLSEKPAAALRSGFGMK